ncbi:lipid kinase [Candidatus Cyanaurora vandensis]|uniref:lipid kinase n=1 Tax=Candidatus Cyanaurora vandensis TaxID=2714958 RepID=UPI00257C42ED|nr:lipid kinase [Candidatus Cyanaurora vandensis]
MVEQERTQELYTGTMDRPALLLVNPHARQVQQRLTEVRKQLTERGFTLIEETIPDPADLPSLLARYRERVECVIVGGGDGTLNAVVDGLVGVGLPLGVLPLGTANDLARTLNIPLTVPEACQVIQTGQPKQIDLGWVNGKHFFNVASLGLTTRITQRLTGTIKKRWGVFAYALTAFQVVGQARPFRAEVRVDGQSFSVRTLQIAVGNGRYYGGGLTVATDAAIDDQRLDLYSLECNAWWQVVSLLPAMSRGDQGRSPLVSALQGQEIEILTQRPRRISTDGELTVTTPARFKVIPLALSVLVPQ